MLFGASRSTAGHERDGRDTTGALVAHLDARELPVATGSQKLGDRAHRTDPVRREEMQDDVAAGASGRVLGRKVDKCRNHTAVKDPPRVAVDLGEIYLDRAPVDRANTYPLGE